MTRSYGASIWERISRSGRTGTMSIAWLYAPYLTIRESLTMATTQRNADKLWKYRPYPNNINEAKTLVSFSEAYRGRRASHFLHSIDATERGWRPPGIARPGDFLIDKRLSGYRMDGVAFMGFDYGIVEMDYHLDSYGHVPECFPVLTDTFPNPLYFHDAGLLGDHAYWHNGYVACNPASLLAYGALNTTISEDCLLTMGDESIRLIFEDTGEESSRKRTLLLEKFYGEVGVLDDGTLTVLEMGVIRGLS